jgi:hypothetical protein
MKNNTSKHPTPTLPKPNPSYAKIKIKKVTIFLTMDATEFQDLYEYLDSDKKVYPIGLLGRKIKEKDNCSVGKLQNIRLDRVVSFL